MNRINTVLDIVKYINNGFEPIFIDETSISTNLCPNYGYIKKNGKKSFFRQK